MELMDPPYAAHAAHAGPVTAHTTDVTSSEFKGANVTAAEAATAMTTAGHLRGKLIAPPQAIGGHLRLATDPPPSGFFLKGACKRSSASGWPSLVTGSRREANGGDAYERAPYPADLSRLIIPPALPKLRAAPRGEIHGIQEVSNWTLSA
jgi:hypothetical protein